MKTYLKRNKPLLFLPLVMIPFVVLIFYILGGGQAKRATEASPQYPITQGANYELPDADHNLEIRDKTELNEEVEMMTRSHDYNIFGDADVKGNDSTGFTETAEMIAGEAEVLVPETRALVSSGDPDDLLKHIQQREKQIRSELDAGEKTQPEPKDSQPQRQSQKAAAVTRKQTESQAKQSLPVTGIDELDQVFKQNRQLSRQNDSLAIQLKEATAFREMVEAERQKSMILEKGSFSAFKPAETSAFLLKAEVYETTTVLTGNRLKLRLLEDATITGIPLRAGTFFYGTCEVANERLRIHVRQLPFKDAFIPVDISVYDLDGLPGLYVPDNAARKVAKEVGSSTNTSSMFGVTGNPLTYASVQAADRTAQSLLRLVRLKKVTVKKNTQVWLINQSK